MVKGIKGYTVLNTMEKLNSPKHYLCLHDYVKNTEYITEVVKNTSYRLVCLNELTL